MGAFKEPHGGELKQLYLSSNDVEQAKQAAQPEPELVEDDIPFD